MYKMYTMNFMSNSQIRKVRLSDFPLDFLFQQYAEMWKITQFRFES